MAQVALTQVRAAFNKDHSLLGKQDPYCVIEVEARRVTSPVIKDGGVEVAWDGTFTLPVTTQNLAEPLKIEVYNKHSLMPDSLIGQAELPLSKLQDGQMTNVPLFDKKANPTGNFCFVSRASSALASQATQGAQYVGSGTSVGDEHRHGHSGPLAGAAAAAGGAGLLHKDRTNAETRTQGTSVDEAGGQHRGVGAAIADATGLGRHGKHGHGEAMGTQTGTQQTGSAYDPALGGVAPGQGTGGHLGRDAALAAGAAAGAAGLGNRHQGQGVGTGSTLGSGTGTQTGATTYGSQVGSGGIAGQGLAGQGLGGQGITGQGITGHTGQGTTGQGVSGQGMNGQGHLERDAALAGGAAATAAGLGHQHRDMGIGQGGVLQGGGYGAQTDGANITRDMGNLNMTDGQPMQQRGTETGGIRQAVGSAVGAVTGHNMGQQRGATGTIGTTGTGLSTGTGTTFGAGAQGSPAASKWASMEQFLRDECKIQDPQDLLSKFTVNKVDVDALFLLKPTDLSGLGIPLGDMRKLESAMDRYRSSGAGNILGQSAQQANFTRPGDYQR